MIRKSYADGGFGQIHLRANAAAPGAALLCLHATAYSSLSFEPLLAALDGHRHAVAMDAPGYGGSDAPPAPVDMAAYGDAIAAGLDSAGLAGPIDLFGYHTGVCIATELAIRHPGRVGRLVLMGVPYFAALDFAAWKAKLTVRHQLGESLEQFAERWDYLVRQRPAGLTLQQGFANFVDELRAWPHGWWAHQALFDYDCAGQFAKVTQPVLILNPEGHLAAASRAAAALFSDAEVRKMPGLNGAVLHRHADRIAELTEAFLLGERELSASAAE